METKEILEVFTSTDCPCGKRKTENTAFCYKCFKSLPKKLQRDLYNRFYDGFQEAFNESATVLGIKFETEKV